MEAIGTLDSYIDKSSLGAVYFTFPSRSMMVCSSVGENIINGSVRCVL